MSDNQTVRRQTGSVLAAYTPLRVGSMALGDFSTPHEMTGVREV